MDDDILKTIANYTSPGDTIAVSACLLGHRCRYDGKGFDRHTARELERIYTVVPICPESVLGTPRPPCECMDGKVLTCNGDDVTSLFVEGADSVVSRCREEDVVVAVLKSRSPSCGVGTIYDGSFSGTLAKGNGVAASRLMEAGIVCIPMD